MRQLDGETLSVPSHGMLRMTESGGAKLEDIAGCAVESAPASGPSPDEIDSAWPDELPVITMPLETWKGMISCSMIVTQPSILPGSTLYWRSS